MSIFSPKPEWTAWVVARLVFSWEEKVKQRYEDSLWWGKEGARQGTGLLLDSFGLQSVILSAPLLELNKLPDFEPCQLATPPNPTCSNWSWTLTQQQEQEQYPKATPPQLLPSLLPELARPSSLRLQAATPKFHCWLCHFVALEKLLNDWSLRETRYWVYNP